jgi:hypothetical protein
MFDPTLTEQERNREWTLDKLDRHAKSGFHSREEELIRAVRSQPRSGFPCPLCHDEIVLKKHALRHFQEEHPEQLLIDRDVIDEVDRVGEA